MALPIWPGPIMLADGYTRTPTSPTIRTQMESGRAEYRRRFRVFPIPIQGSFHLTDQQLQDCTEFVQDTLNGWASPFLLTLRDHKGVRQVRARFLAPATETLVSPSGVWRWDAQLETLNIY